MIQIIDEEGSSTTKNVLRGLVEWNSPNDKDIPEKIMQDWVDQLGTNKLSEVMNFYSARIRKSLWKEQKLDIQAVPLFQRYACLVSFYGQKAVVISFENVQLSPVLKQLSTDILGLTMPRYNDEEDASDYDLVVRTIVLPTLIRMIGTILFVTCQQDRSVLTQISSLLLAFDHVTLNSSFLLPSLDRLDLMMDCAIPMSIPCVIDWNAVELDSASWKDDVVVSESKLCWNALAKNLGVRIIVADDSHLSMHICAELGWETVAKVVRAQFFGKENDSALLNHKSKKPLTYPLQMATPLATEPVHRREHARIHAALVFVKIVEAPSKLVLAEMLPICYTLIDSAVASLVAMGCTALMVLLSACQNTEDWKGFEDALISVLDMTAKAAADPSSVGFVCLACSRTFERFGHRGKDRRRLTLRFLDLMTYKMRNRSDGNGMLRNILICGLIPLLKQQSRHAEAMEMGD